MKKLILIGLTAASVTGCQTINKAGDSVFRDTGNGTFLFRVTENKIYTEETHKMWLEAGLKDANMCKDGYVIDSKERKYFGVRMWGTDHIKGHCADK